MALTVWKYAVPLTDTFSLSLPVGARVLTVQVQAGQGVMLWALGDPDQETRLRYFRLVGTGHAIDEVHALEYVGSVQLDQGTLVFHLFEVPTGPFTES